MSSGDPWWLRTILLCVALSFLALFLFLPLASVFTEALAHGWRAYLAALRSTETLAAIGATAAAVAIAVPINVAFGLVASWTVAKFRFRGRALLLTLIDLPFSVSPVVAGLMLVLVFGLRGWLGPWLEAHELRVIFAVPGVVLATVFVTFPYVARELIPLMEAQGTDEEEAAIVLGASGLTTFFRVTLPNIRFGLLYGVVLCSARAVGEFGAVSVVSGHVRGETNTLPLHVEALYNDYNFVAAFAVASLLALGALVSLLAKALVEWAARRDRAAPPRRATP